MEPILYKGDTQILGSGDFIKASGVQAVFQRGEILLNMRCGRFYLSPESGVLFNDEDLEDLERMELLINEALAPVEGLSARLLSMEDGKALIKLIYRGETKECEVAFDEQL